MLSRMTTWLFIGASFQAGTTSILTYIGAIEPTYTQQLFTGIGMSLIALAIGLGTFFVQKAKGDL